MTLFLTAYFSIQAQQLKNPSEFLGYELGSQFTRHHQVVDYFQHVAETFPEQVNLQKYGETYERRPLYIAILSSKENMDNIETIRTNNLKRAGVLEGQPTSDETVIVWLSYNVHGNEASSTEAAMNTIYKLLTEHNNWLQNTVIIMDPLINPDGRDRYVNWYNETKSTPYDTDPQASEHDEPWPGGRANHYLFDLNRDWAWATQIESQSRLKVYNKWLPQIHVDFHEQGINEPYYFAPAAEPFHEIITDWQRDFQTQLGKNHAKYFDEEGWLYFTKERFDLLYPSYGDTYPTYLGAIGMTYEKAGGGRGGLGVKTDEGTVLTLKDRLQHHTTTGLSTVELASKNSEKLNEEFSDYFTNNKFKNKSYVLKGKKDNLKMLTDLLDRHEIKYGYSGGGKVSGYDYSTGKAGNYNTDSKDLVISGNQPKGKMVKALFEPQAYLSDSLTYDITAWSLPYAYGLQAIESDKIVNTSPVAMENVRNTISTNATAYVLEWDSMKDAQFLAEILKKDIKVRFNEEPFSIDGNSFNRGSLLIIRGENKEVEEFDQKLVNAANKYDQRLYSASSGFVASGPDFGSPSVKLVKKQSIALLSGNSVSSLNYGALWHFFEQQLGYPVTSLNTDNLNRLDLSKYDVLIIPDGYYGNLINEQLFNKLKDWVREGGKLIAFGNALNIFAGKEGFDLERKKTAEKDSSETVKPEDLIPYSQRERDNAKNFITGAIFQTRVDNTHPMAYGYPENYFTLKRG
ncbi:MAG: M14 family metallopeptidase, partial [Flavobacteriaceae bacterium]|nr:M14 family metallopeptidase [Flavobacteriaceae bacterium]